MLATEGLKRSAEAVPGSAPSMPTNPLGRHGHGSDVVYLALFLCGPAARRLGGPAARFVSCQVIAVDGARSADTLRMQAGPI